MTDITIATLTEATLDGNGVFDRLMAATKVHLEDQFLKGRIKGTEYATVYLGQVQSVMQAALTFVTSQQEINLKAQLLEQQVELTKAEVLKAQAEVLVAQQEVETAKATVLLTQAQVIKIEQENLLIPKQAAHLDAEIQLLDQQVLNAVQEVEVSKAKVLQANAEVLNLAKQGTLIDAQARLTNQQADNAVGDLDLTVANTNHINQVTANLVLEGQNLSKQGAQITAQTALVTQQEKNSEQENKNLVAQECLLKAQYDGTVQTTLKSAQETTLLAQKVVTEQAQTMGMAIDANSVIGRQTALFKAQTDGFSRDAEQKAAKILIDTWNTRRMTDDATIAGQSPDGGVDNGLGDGNIARAVTKLLGGVGA